MLLYPVDNTISLPNTNPFIHWIVIYLVDNVNQPLNNWDQKLGGISYKV